MDFIPFLGEIGLAGREQPGALNVTISGGSPFTAHSSLYQDDLVLDLMSVFFSDRKPGEPLNSSGPSH